MNQQPMQNPKPKVAKWLWITLIIVAVLAAGFFAWWFLMGPGKKTETTTPTTTKTDKTAGWKTYENTKFGFSFKYPPTLQEQTSNAIVSLLPKNAPAGNGLSITESDKTIDALKTEKEQAGKEIDSNYKMSKSTIDGKTVYIATELSGTEGGVKDVIIDAPTKVLLLTCEGSVIKDLDTILSTFKFTETKTETTTTTETKSQFTYTNSTYGFSIDFPEEWDGYKFKEAEFDGVTITYYVEVPTTASEATGDSTADAGYYSPFAISVYTLAQWEATQAVEGPKDAEITRNDTYVFAWAQANGVPPADFTEAMQNQIKEIIESFELD